MSSCTVRNNETFNTYADTLEKNVTKTPSKPYLALESLNELRDQYKHFLRCNLHSPGRTHPLVVHAPAGRAISISILLASRHLN